MNRRDFIKLSGMIGAFSFIPEFATKGIEMATYTELMMKLADGKTLDALEKEQLRQFTNDIDDARVLSQRLNSNASFKSVDTKILNKETLARPVKIFRSTNQTIPNNTNTDIVFDTVVENGENGFVDITNFPKRITVPQGMGGKYIVGFHIITAAMNVAGGWWPYFNAGLKLNGTGFANLCNDSKYMANGFAAQVHANIVHDFDEGDYIELVTFNYTGNDLDVSTYATNRSPIMYMYKLP